MEWLSNLAKLTKPQGACCDGEVVEDLETAGFSRGSRRSRVPSLPVLCHVAVGWLSHVCVTSSPECLAVPCPERALLCLLNGGLRFVGFNGLPLPRGQRLRAEDVPQLGTHGSRACPQPCHLPAPRLQARDGHSHTWVPPYENTKISFTVCWGFFKDISGSDYVITLPKQRLLLLISDPESSS